MAMTVQLLGFFLGLLGFIGTVVATLLPHWRSAAYMGSNIITATAYMKGLWMVCVWHSTGIYQCEVYRSLLALPRDLQAARALMVLSCLTSVMAALLAVLGMKCTHFVQRPEVKSTLVMIGGVCFACAGFLCLVTVSWTTNDVMMEFYKPLPHTEQAYEIGLSVYLGYASAFLSFTGGLLLCRSSKTDKLRSPPQIRRSELVLPPPTFTNIHPPAPLYKPPGALKDNRALSLSSLSSNGYSLKSYF